MNSFVHHYAPSAVHWSVKQFEVTAVSIDPPVSGILTEAVLFGHPRLQEMHVSFSKKICVGINGISVLCVFINTSPYIGVQI